jgi:uncharacterized repeat protein (TIGR01451 family)
MHRPKWSAVPLAVLGLVVSGWAGSSEAKAQDWMDKVDPWVLSTAGANEKTEFLVFLREQASVRGAAALASKEEKGEFVSLALRETAARTQAPVLDDLKSLGAEFRPYWIANMIWVRGDLEVARLMAERPDVLRVSANPTVKLEQLPPDPSADPEAPSAVEWGITKAGAPGAWALGFKGIGVVIAGQDTGYQWDHAALKGKYRGWNGSAANHNYNWHDSIHSGGGVCGANSQAPCDDDSHGTHTMGTMVGDDGAGNQVGMAPQAKWMGCRNMDQGNGTPATYAECFEWFVAPTNLAGLNPDTTKAPHVINNSWGCPISEGCTDPLVLKTVVENTRAAGIVVVVSAGNAGPGCESVNDPPAIYDASFSVGATDSGDSIASFSSRGPVSLDGSGRLKPDVSAPGVGVRSSVPGGGYSSFSGTSMAGPHVAGHVALLLSAMPSWKGQVGLIEERIAHSAVPRTSGETCGGVSGSEVPNNTFGWGRIDALASVSMVDLGIQIVDTPDPVAVGGQLTYKVYASNSTPGVVTATNVIATVTLSPFVSFVSAPAGCTHASGVVTCSFGSIVKGTSSQKDIVVTVNSGGTIQSSGTITGTLYDLNSGNNQTWVTTVAGSGADLKLTMTAPWSPALAGVPFTYSLTAQNLGPASAGLVAITDTLPAGAAFSSASAGCANASGTVTCDLGTLNSGTSSIVSITVVPSGASSMTNGAVVAGDSVDPNPANSSASVTTGVVAAQPAGLEVDAHAGGGVGSDVNGVFEPGEQVVVNPSWVNPSGGSATITGTAFEFGPVSVSGGTYTIADAAASYGSIGAGASIDCWTGAGDCYELAVPVPDVRPATHWDARMRETLSTGIPRTWFIHLGDSFTDVPRSHWAYRFVETVLHNGVTAGCGVASYCPDTSLTRAEMAVFLLAAEHGSDWVPPPSTGTVFTDVPIDFWAGDFIEALAAEGITSGCGASTYCPDNPITRAEMAVFLLAARNGSAWVPPASTGTVFTDVPIDFWAGDFIEALAAEGITSGCGDGVFCPDSPVSRAEMAVFLSSTFGLKLY